ncbi:TonB-dependent receptor [Mucilaginibacter sp. PAMB04168]|uniref:TonB-dependent receptor n=1 Tax=Mucilaginibacter sp. PAMB04168 TaxID=3138567 RepID=UPI0031F6F87B
MPLQRYLIFMLLLTSLLLPGQLLAQQKSHQVEGVVVSNTTPVPFATVALLTVGGLTRIQTLTDSTGRFKLPPYNINGSYVLKVSYVGFITWQSTPFRLRDTLFSSISLQASAKTLKDVVIQGKKNPIELDGSTLVYNVSGTIAGQGVTALEALKKAPGVFVENESNITLNGKAGVLIMIDGKQTYLSGKELTDLLKAMPSSSIKSIEIMNNPSAKYEASGTAGIINIKTNRILAKGFNGSVTTGVAYGITAKQNEDISLNYRTGKLNVYGSYSHFLGNYTYVYGTDRLQSGKNYNSDTYDVDKRQKMSGRVGADYVINRKNTIGLLVSGNFIFGGGLTDTKTLISTPPASGIDQTLDAYNDYYGQHTERYNFNLNYKYEDTAGHTFNVDADYGLFNKWNGNLQSNVYRDAQALLQSQNLYRTLNDIDINLRGIKVDYTTNLFSGQLESGLKYSSVASGNDARFYHVLAFDSLDYRRSNDFKYTEQISAGYVSYKKTMAKWQVQAGLRLENTASTGNLRYQTLTADSLTIIHRNYTSLFPAVSITLKPTKLHSVALSYAKRIERPAYQDLNPFVYLLDELSFWQGNPFLKPQLVHRLGLLYAYKSSTIVGLNFLHTNQFSANVTDTLQQNKIVMVSRNLGTQTNWSASLTQLFALTNKWDVTFNGLLYYIKNDIAFDQYRALNLKQLAYRMSLQQTIKLPFDLTGEIISTFNSHRLTGANNFVQATSQLDLGLQRLLFNKKATIRLAVNDIYKGNQSRFTQSFPGYYATNYGYYESRQVRLNFIYRFTGGNAKGPRARNSALDAETGRIK